MRFFPVFLVAALSIGQAGCTQQSEQGGPGADANTNVDTSDDQIENSADTFTLSVPAVATNVTQGERQEVTIEVNRGSNFTQPVTLQFTAPSGVDVTPMEAVVQPSDETATISIEASDTATPGVASIEVLGMPKTGKQVSVAMKLDIRPR